MTSVKNSDNVFRYRIKNKLKMSLKTIFNKNVEPQKKVRCSYKKKSVHCIQSGSRKMLFAIWVGGEKKLQNDTNVLHYSSL